MRNNRFRTMIGQAIVATGLLVGSTVASAATVSVLPVTQGVFEGDTVTVDLVGTGFDNVTGGSMDVLWDPTVLTMADISGVSLILEPTSPWQAAVSDPGVLSAGLIDSLRVGLLAFPTGFTGDAAIATLTFTALNAGSTTVTVRDSLSPGGGWSPDQAPTDNTTTMFYEAGNVNVQVVPIPAAVWLFGSGLLGLVGVARRRRG